MEVNTFWFGPANAHRTCLAEDAFPPLFPDAMPTFRSLSAVDERFGDSLKGAPNYTFPVTRERWAQIGITTQFLIVVRTLGEIFRLKHAHGADFSAAAAMAYVGGALIAACSCWAGVTLYFLRRYALSAWIALATVVILLAYKIFMIGW